MIVETCEEVEIRKRVTVVPKGSSFYGRKRTERTEKGRSGNR